MNMRGFGEGCVMPTEQKDFEMFFVECVIICADENIGPDDYVWDLKNPGAWEDKFNLGMTPREAVASFFQSQ